MIPALTGPAIRQRPEQVQQVITDIGDRGRHGTRSRLVISKDNGRLDHGEAPGMTRICRKIRVIPELRLKVPGNRGNSRRLVTRRATCRLMRRTAAVSEPAPTALLRLHPRSPEDC